MEHLYIYIFFISSPQNASKDWASSTGGLCRTKGMHALTLASRSNGSRYVLEHLNLVWFTNCMLNPSQVRESLVIEAMCHYGNPTKPVFNLVLKTHTCTPTPFFIFFSLLRLLRAAAEAIEPGQPVNVPAMIQSSLDRSAVEDWVIK